jgi:hypothetical protein
LEKYEDRDEKKKDRKKERKKERRKEGKKERRKDGLTSERKIERHKERKRCLISRFSRNPRPYLSGTNVPSRNSERKD